MGHAKRERQEFRYERRILLLATELNEADLFSPMQDEDVGLSHNESIPSRVTQDEMRPGSAHRSGARPRLNLDTTPNFTRMCWVDAMTTRKCKN